MLALYLLDLDGGTPFQLARHTCQVGLTVGYVLAPHDGSSAAPIGIGTA